VGRAEAIYKHEGKYAAPVDVVLSHWGYTGMSGPASRQVAALKKFGLIEDEGSKTDRQIRLSDLALRIVMPDSPERAESLKVAALKPAIHQELLAKYKDGLPASDGSIRWHLVSDLGFTENAAQELIAEYRATLKFAGLDPSSPPDNLGATDIQEPEEDPSQSRDMDMSDARPPNGTTPSTREEAEQNETKTKASSTMRDLTIPLPGTAWVKIEGEFPMAEDSWDQLLAMLSAMKPGLTRPND